MLSIIRYLWVSACVLVLVYWVNQWHLSPEMEDAYRLESQGVVLVFMMLLSFPSGILFYFLLSLVFSGLDTLGVSTVVDVEVPLVWIGFFIVGYLQWFKYGPKLIRLFVEWRRS